MCWKRKIIPQIYPELSKIITHDLLDQQQTRNWCICQHSIQVLEMFDIPIVDTARPYRMGTICIFQHSIKVLEMFDISMVHTARPYRMGTTCFVM